MNSPVSCLRDPIQNMVKKSKNNNKKGRNMPKKSNALVVRQQPKPFLRTVGAPAAYGSIQGRNPVLPMGAITPRGCIVKNYELSKAFTAGTGAVDVQGFNINPGIATNFPWLSSIAQNYQKFRFLYLRYFYSASISTATPGKAFISLSYDAQDAPPTTLAQAMATDSASAGPAWFGGAVSGDKAFDRMSSDSNIFVDLDVSRLGQPWYYTRNTVAGTQPSSGGALTGAPTGGIGTLAFTQGSYVDESSIPAKCFYGTSGVTNGVVPGELYCAYVCEFIEPVTAAIST